jgi:TRAP-type C4-dicarboxylate transport system permease small subunit
MSKDTNSLVSKIFHGFIVITLSVMVLFVFTNAFLRYTFNTGITQVEELGRYFFIWTVFLGTIAAFKDNQHVGVTILIDTLKGKKLLVLKVMGYIATLIAIGIVLKGSIAYTITSMPSLGPATGIPFGIIACSLTVAAIAIIGLVLVDAYKYFASVGKKEE